MGCVGTEEETEVVVVVWSLFGADVEVIETWDDLVVSWATLAAFERFGVDRQCTPQGF